MDDDRILWLNQMADAKLTPKAAPAAGADRTADLQRAIEARDLEDEQRRQVLIAGALRLIEPLKDSLKASMDVRLQNQVEINLKITKLTRKGKKRKFQDSRKAEAADTDELRQDSEVSNPNLEDDQDPATEARKAFDVVEGIRQDLTDERTRQPMLDTKADKIIDGPPIPLFSDTRILDDLIDPLLRAGVLPDGFLIEKFSRNQQMITATNDLYKKTLTDETAHVGLNLAAMSDGAVTVATNMCSAALAAAGHDPAMVQSIITGCGVLATMMIDGTNAIDDAVRYKLDPDKISKLFTSSLPSLLSQAITAGTGDSTLASAVSNAVGALTYLGNDAVRVAKGIYDGDPKSKLFDQAVKDIAGAIGAAMQAAVGGVNDGLTRADDSRAASTATNDALIAELGKFITTAGSDYSRKVVNALRKGSLAGVEGALLPLCTDFAAMLPATALDAEAVGGVNTSAQTERGASSTVQAGVALDVGAQKAIAGKAVEAAMPEAAKKKDIETEKQERLKKFREEYDKKLGAELAKDLAKEIEDDKKDFDKVIQGLDKISQDNDKLDEVIAKMQRNAAIFNVAVAIGMGGAEVAGTFFSYAAVGTQSIKLVMNMTKAVNNVVNLVNYGVTLSRMRDVNSNYESALQNVMSNQTFQLFQNGCTAALNGVRLAAVVAASACPYAQPANPAVAGFQAAVDVGFKAAQVKRMRSAWAATRKALDNPQNRRLAHRARELNPTLAKYTIAYGAMVVRDPSAIVIAGKLGLDDDCLKSKNANVDKVKKFLELKFPDDGTVKGHYEEEKKNSWVDTLPRAAVSTVIAVRAWQIVDTAADGKLGKAPPSELLGLLATAEKSIKALPKPPKGPPLDAPTMEAYRQAERVCEELEKAFETEGKRIGADPDLASIAEPAKSVMDDFATAASAAAFDAFMEQHRTEATV
jgi:hypothetical protein